MEAHIRKGILLQGVHKTLGNCKRCPLHAYRQNIVFGGGNPDAPITIVTGTVSGAEDRTGQILPPSNRGEGALEILDRAMRQVGLEVGRDIYAITILKCQRPMEMNDEGQLSRASADHADASKCLPFAKWQMDIVKSPLVVAHGRFASEVLFGERRPLVAYCGAWRQFGKARIALSTHNPGGLFGDRRSLIPEYMLHWRGVAERLNLLGRLWKPEAVTFAQGWSFQSAGENT
jgi:uracil-DNA glycosylase family 4